MTNIVGMLEQEYCQNKETPKFNPGDTVAVQVKVTEGKRERLQTYKGVVIGRRNRGHNSSFTVMKMSQGVRVERTFPLYSPTIEKVTVERAGDVRRAKLYYLRELTGRAARIKEKIPASAKASAKKKGPSTDLSAKKKDPSAKASPKKEGPSADLSAEALAKAEAKKDKKKDD